MAIEEATLIKPSTSTFILRSTSSGDEFPLEGEMVVGREAECAIPIKSGHISRYHAKFNVMRSGVYIEDLHSTNGTYVNGQKIKGRVLLSLGDEVSFDSIGFRVASPGSGQEKQTLLAPPRMRVKQPARVASKAARPAAATPKPAPTSNVQPFPTAKPAPSQSTPESSSEADKPDSIAPPKKVKPVDEARKAEPQDAEIPNEPAPRANQKPAAPPEQSEQPKEHTRMLSGAELGQHAERNRSKHKDINLGQGPRLIIMTAPLRGKYFELDDAAEGKEWRVGRGAESDIRLTDKTISSDHARLLKLENGYKLQATHAKNGILVNGTPINQVYLGHDDKIQIGSAELVFKTDFTAPGSKYATTAPEERNHNLAHIWIGAAVVLAALISAVVLSKG